MRPKHWVSRLPARAQHEMDEWAGHVDLQTLMRHNYATARRAPRLPRGGRHVCRGAPGRRERERCWWRCSDWEAHRRSFVRTGIRCAPSSISARRPSTRRPVQFQPRSSATGSIRAAAGSAGKRLSSEPCRTSDKHLSRRTRSRRGAVQFGRVNWTRRWTLEWHVNWDRWGTLDL